MRTPSNSAMTLKFNLLFEHNPLQEAVKKASEMEQQRAIWSQLPLLQEIYRPAWREWTEMPGGELVAELMELYEAERREYSHEPWFPRPYLCAYLWDGQMTLDEFKILEIRQFATIEQGVSGTAFATARAYMQHDRELKELAVWWQHDEQTHQEMEKFFLINYLGVPEDELLRTAREFTDQLTSVPSVGSVRKENVGLISRLQAIRDGPPVLMGCAILGELENMWTYQKTVPVLREHFGFPNDALPFFNVHSFVDYFHIRLGQYIIGRYASTDELRGLCRAFFVAQREGQRRRSEEIYEKLRRGELGLTMSRADNI